MSLDQVQINELYYTASEARAALGLNDNTFQTWVKTKRINRIMLPGHGKGVYLKSEVDRKVAMMHAALFFDEAKELEYRQATISDMDAENHLSYLVFGKKAVTPRAIELTRRLAKISPESTYHLYDRGELASSINFVPLNHNAIIEFIAGKRGWLFGEESIEKFEPGKPLECIIIDFISRPDVPPSQRSKYGQMLLTKFLGTTLQQWGEQGVEITKIYANGGTDIGKKLLAKAGGKVVNIASHELYPDTKRTIYEIDVASSDKLIFMPYKATLARWKSTNTR